MTKSQINDFLKNNTDSKILKRGKDYFENGNVEQFTEGNDVYKAKVKGSDWELYQVEIGVSDDDGITSCSCDCPFDDDKICKHIVSVILKISERSNAVSIGRKKGVKTVEEIVESATIEELSELVIQMANKYKEYEAELRFNIFHSFEDEFTAIKKFYANSKRTNTHRGYIGYSSCDRICSDMERILQKVEKHIASEQYSNAIDILMYLMTECGKLVSTADDSSGYLSEVIDNSLVVIEIVIEQIAESKMDIKEKDKMAAKLLRTAKNKVFNGWDFGLTIALLATRLATKKNSAKFYKIIDDMESKNNDYFAYYSKKLKLFEYNIILNVDGEVMAFEFAQDNTDIDELRIILIDDAMENKNYDLAEQLCLEIIDFDNIPAYNRVDIWKRFLYNLYEETNNSEKRNIILRALFMDGDLDAFNALKNILKSKNEWEKEYPVLLRNFKDNKYIDFYLELLAMENEIDMLMEEVENHKEFVFKYGELLYPKYGNRLNEICVGTIWEKMNIAYNISGYNRAAVLIQHLYDLGGKEHSIKLIEDLKKEYPKRKAMIGLLNQLEVDV